VEQLVAEQCRFAGSLVAADDGEWSESLSR